MTEGTVVISKLGVSVRNDLFGQDLGEVPAILVHVHNGALRAEVYDPQSGKRFPLYCLDVEAGWDDAFPDTF